MGNKNKNKPRNVGDEDQVAELTLLEQRVLQQRDDDLKAIMDTVHGRRFMWDLLGRKAGITTLSFTGNSETFFNEGQRNIGLAYLADIDRVCPDNYIQMLIEARKEKSDG